MMKCRFVSDSKKISLARINRFLQNLKIFIDRRNNTISSSYDRSIKLLRLTLCVSCAVL